MVLLLGILLIPLLSINTSKDDLNSSLSFDFLGVVNEDASTSININDYTLIYIYDYYYQGDLTSYVIYLDVFKYDTKASDIYIGSFIKLDFIDDVLYLSYEGQGHYYVWGVK